MESLKSSENQGPPWWFLVVKLDEVLKDRDVDKALVEGWIRTDGTGSWGHFSRIIRQHFGLDDEDEEVRSKGRDELLGMAHTLALEILGYEPLPALAALPQVAWSALFWAKVDELNGLLSQADVIASRWDFGQFRDEDELFVMNILNGLVILSDDIAQIRKELLDLGVDEPIRITNPLLVALFIEAGIESGVFSEDLVCDLPEMDDDSGDDGGESVEPSQEGE